MDTSQSQRKDMKKILLLFFGCFIIGVVFYHTVEDFSFSDAIYFTAMTLTTVGYGDFFPHTDAGKLFTTVYAFLGIGIFLGFANTVLRGALRQSLRKTLHDHIHSNKK
jgi:hypothetical protein